MKKIIVNYLVPTVIFIGVFLTTFGLAGLVMTYLYTTDIDPVIVILTNLILSATGFLGGIMLGLLSVGYYNNHKN